MNSQQLLDHIIKPTLEDMGGNYNSKNAQMLSLATAAIESKCGYYIKQINGPALGIWQMEPATEGDIWQNCDALQDDEFNKVVRLMLPQTHDQYFSEALIIAPRYACAMARLKYSMDENALPFYGSRLKIYKYYKRIYNTPLGASTLKKFNAAWYECNLDKIIL